jgi:hypothetical protein
MGRHARGGDKDTAAALFGVLYKAFGYLGGAMCRGDTRFKRDIKGAQHIETGLHHGQVRIRSHHNRHKRLAHQFSPQQIDDPDNEPLKEREI